MTVEEARSAGLFSKARKRKAKLPDSHLPHQCVTMGVDLGRMSGWGILLRGGETWDSFLLPPQKARLWYGQSSNPDDWFRGILLAKDLARLNKLPLVVLFETWTQGDPRRDRRMRAMTLLGLGETRGEWKRLMKIAKVPRCRAMTVNAMTWRSKILGGRVGRTRDAWKTAAVEHVRGLYGGLMESTVPGGAFGHDAAEGVCLSEYGARCGQVGQIVERAGNRSP